MTRTSPRLLASRTALLSTALAAAFLLVASACGRRGGEAAETAVHDTLTQAPEARGMGPIHYDLTLFPGESVPDLTLISAVYPDDEIPADYPELAWTGLMRGPKGYYVAPVKLRWSRFQDPQYDPESGDEPLQAWEVKAETSDSALLFFRDASLVHAGPVKPARTDRMQVRQNSRWTDASQLPNFRDLRDLRLYPGDSARLTHNGTPYLLYAQGGSAPAEHDQLEVWNYKLYVQAEVKGTLKTSLLMACPQFDDAFISILFAGDLDNDGILDWILNTSPKYSYEERTYFRSGNAPKKQLVVPVSRHVMTGC